MVIIRLLFSLQFYKVLVVITNEPIDTAKKNFGELIGSENVEGYRNLVMTSQRLYYRSSSELREPNSSEEARNSLLGKKNM